MTVLELTRLVSRQDDRWASILTHAQGTRHPGAKAGIAFFHRTWRPVMNDYFQTVAGRYGAQAKVPMQEIRGLLDKMADVVYPAARAIGLPDNSFVLPDITIERGQSATSVAGYSWMYW